MVFVPELRDMRNKKYKTKIKRGDKFLLHFTMVSCRQNHEVMC